MDSQPMNANASAVSAQTNADSSTETSGSTRQRRAAPQTLPLAEPLTEAQQEGKYSLDDASLYLNRELTWLSFNQRVLNEAADERVPLMERLKFIAIVSSNLDEFFMKRIGGLKQLMGARIQRLTVDGRTPLQQQQVCYEMVKVIDSRARELLAEVLELLKAYGVEVVSYQALSKEEQGTLRQYFYENIFPLMTPQSMDPAHPFPFISNLSLNLLVGLRYNIEDSPYCMARVKIPTGGGIPRFIQIGDSYRYIALEELIRHNLDLLFPDMIIETTELFRVTRNANTERSEEHADDLLELIETELRDRRFAPIVRMQVHVSMDTTHRGMLAAELGLDENQDVFEVDGTLAMRDFMQFMDLPFPDLHDEPHQAIDHPKLQDIPNIFHTLRENKNILLHHPYESFSTSVERFLREASRDPKVRAIKMTLYRTSSNTKVIDYLIEAARNDKQVAVVVELKARFDEAANIKWASRMEEAGIHVTYGVLGLKTHSKVILVVRQDFSYNKIQRYAHIGTGNYHAGTAKLYGDLGLLTCDEEIGADLTDLFNFLTTGFSLKRTYRKILPSPKLLKNALIDKINREIELHTAENPGLIQFKVNALEDVDVTKALYKAAQAGVRINLIVRDTCRIRPKLPGLTDSLSVISVVGRFLEHTRVYYFRNNGNEEYFIGSADTMQRNLESRVEVVTPIEDPALRSELRMILDTQLNDQRSAWEMQADGSYIQRQARSRNETSCQGKLIEWYKELHKNARKTSKRRNGVKRKRNLK